MNIKVGDKVRIKTEEELLAEGWERYGEMLIISDGKDLCSVPQDQCNTEHKVIYIYSNGVDIDIDVCKIAICAVKKVETLDEYICNLPLEERAKYFVYCSEYDWYSTLLGKDAHFVFEEEAIQATIEALKQPKEDK